MLSSYLLPRDLPSLALWETLKQSRRNSRGVLPPFSLLRPKALPMGSDELQSLLPGTSNRPFADKDDTFLVRLTALDPPAKLLSFLRLPEDMSDLHCLRALSLRAASSLVLSARQAEISLRSLRHRALNPAGTPLGHSLASKLLNCLWAPALSGFRRSL